MPNDGAFEGGDTRIGELGFPAWTDVSRRNSIADLIRIKTRRCGVHVLGFANGERYVGLSTDVVKRFAQHRLVHGDITSFTFRRVAKKDGLYARVNLNMQEVLTLQSR